MVRCGAVDPNDLPTPQNPLLPACPVCEKADAACRACNGRGVFRVEQDPREIIPRFAYRVAEFAELYLENGVPPVSGGALDQSHWFITAAGLCVADRKRILAEHYGET